MHTNSILAVLKQFFGSKLWILIDKMLGWSMPSLSFGRPSGRKDSRSDAEASPISDAAGPSKAPVEAELVADSSDKENIDNDVRRPSLLRTNLCCWSGIVAQLQKGFDTFHRRNAVYAWCSRHQFRRPPIAQLSWRILVRAG
jgi:hypothetical protein